MLRKSIALAILGLAFVAGPASAAHPGYEHRHVDFSFEGPFGKFDEAQLQRGYKVYREVCAACHAMDMMYFRNLGQAGGPFYDPEYKNPNDNPYVKSLAKDIQVPDIDTDTGDAIQRPATPADKFPKPFPNEYAARASNGGALPPDLSVIAKAREGGAHYIYSLLTGYRNPATYRNEDGHALPAENRPGEGLHFNPYFPNLNLAMAPPLASEGQVTYSDGTRASVDQMAKDVAAFLTWTAEPTLVKRKQTGWAVLGFLLFATVLAWFAKKQVWAPVVPKRRKD